MIQCDLCLCWQHGICHNIESSHQVPDKHVCFICKNPYRQRLSTRFVHDQDWLYDGKLPISNYHVENPKQAARFDTLKQCHTLIGNLIEMKKFMNSLDVKINIAENSEHPKLYLWAKKWEESPPREKSSDSDSKDDLKMDEDVKMPLAPEPEAAIEPKKCQQTLLDHIQFQQNSVKSRLDMIENEIGGKLIEIILYCLPIFSYEISLLVLEEEAATKIPNGKKPVDDAKLKSTIYMLINDLKQMNDFADIHRNPHPEELL
jgi:PHD finger protein 20